MSMYYLLKLNKNNNKKRKRTDMGDSRETPFQKYVLENTDQNFYVFFVTLQFFLYFRKRRNKNT